MSFLRRLSPVLAATLSLVILVAAAPVAAQGEPSEKIRRKIHAGISYFEQGRYLEAKQLLDEALSLDPTAKEAYRNVQEAGMKIWMQMMFSQEVARPADKIWRLYMRHRRRLTRNEERIKAMVNRVVDPNVHEVVRWRLIHDLQDVGQFAVPYLAPHLMNQRDDERRALARIAIERLGSRAVLPLIELLEHKNELMAANAALILGDIEPSDHRALARLRAMAEPESQVPYQVRKHAIRSLERITGMIVDDLGMKAKDYYYHKILRYYRELPSVPLEAEEADGVIWYLTKPEEGETQQLKYYEVPIYAWNELMAEQACYDLFELHPGFEIAVPLFVRTMAAMYAEVKDLVDVTVERPAGRALSEDEVAEVRDRDILLRGATWHIHAAGARMVYFAIGEALREGRTSTNRDKYAGVATVLIDAVKDLDPTGAMLPGDAPVMIDPETGRAAPPEKGQKKKPKRKRGKEKTEVAAGLPPHDQPRGTGKPLIEALSYDDRRVQYAAAIALAHMNPPQEFDGADQVVELLNQAIGESGPLQLLLIDENAEVRNVMRSKLETLGFTVTTAAEPREGLNFAVRFPIKDLLILSSALSAGFDTLGLIKELKDDARSRYVPVVILTDTDQFERDRNRFPGQMLMAMDAAPEQLRRIVGKATSWPRVRALPVVNRLHAEEVSVAAASALLAINPLLTHMTPADATKALIAALKNRSNAVRNPCARALGKFKLGGAEAIQALTDVFNEKSNSLELRANCLEAIGRIDPVAGRDLLSRAVAEDEREEYIIRFRGSEGFGRGNPTSLDIVPFIEQHRLQKKLKEE